MLDSCFLSETFDGLIRVPYGLHIAISDGYNVKLISE